jgi:hypothetical protein
LTAPQVAQIFGTLEPTDDTPTATHQSHPYICVWGTGVTPAQESADPTAANAALEIVYYRGGAGYAAVAAMFVAHACNATAQPFSGVGDAAYYCQGNMAVVEGSRLIEFHNFSIAPTPSEATEASGMQEALAKLPP